MEQKEVIEKLIADGVTVATAESCTGGLIAAALTAVAGVSAIFGYGLVTYSNEAKQKILGVKKETLTVWGAVSEECAYEMARGLKDVSGADCAVSVTGIAGPGGGSAKKPVGLVYMGLAWGDNIYVKKNLFQGSREEIRRQTVETAFAFIAEKVF
ncbi:MAG TPA: CinA family protein [Clostridiales bacterium]|nr:CinA family protein [Clostridiales bacterium]